MWLVECYILTTDDKMLEAAEELQLFADQLLPYDSHLVQLLRS
jgi:hypothetical protein